MAETEREFKLVLPKRDNSGVRIRTSVLTDIIRDVAEHFNGVSVVPTTLGCYRDSETQRLQCEENLTVTVTRTQSSPDELRADHQFMLAVAHRAAKLFGQEAVMESENHGTHTIFVPGVRRQHLSSELLEHDDFQRLL